MVRRAKRPRRNDARARAEQPGDAVDFGDVERLGGRHRRQNRRQPPREHRFAAAGRSDEHDVVSARGGDLERALRDRLPFHVREVAARCAIAVVEQRRTAVAELRAVAERDRDGVAERRHGIDVDPVTSAASARLASGTRMRANPACLAASAIASTPGTARSSPPSASSPQTT